MCLLYKVCSRRHSPSLNALRAHVSVRPLKMSVLLFGIFCYNLGYVDNMSLEVTRYIVIIVKLSLTTRQWAPDTHIVFPKAHILRKTIILWEIHRPTIFRFLSPSLGCFSWFCYCLCLICKAELRGKHSCQEFMMLPCDIWRLGSSLGKILHMLFDLSWVRKSSAVVTPASPSAGRAYRCLPLTFSPADDLGWLWATDLSPYSNDC